jgi:phosphate uptake regulator
MHSKYLYNNIIVSRGIFVELRKLQMVGNASFSITLPPAWIKEYKMKPSDQITITREVDGSLKLVPGIVRPAKEIKITIDADRCKKTRILMRLIIGGYNRGCDTIEIVSKRGISENHRKEINDATANLMGMGIVESTSNRVTLQSVVDSSKFPMGPILKRFYKLVSSMNQDALQALKDKDTSLAASVIQRENEVDNIYWLMGRQILTATRDMNVLSKIDLKGMPDVALQLLIFPRIKSVSDYAVDIANNLLVIVKNGTSEADLQKIIRLGYMAHKAFSNACEAFFKVDVLLANDAVESFEPLQKMKDELLVDLCPRIQHADLAMRLSNIIRDFRGIVAHAKFIAEVTIDQSTSERSNLP